VTASSASLPRCARDVALDRGEPEGERQASPSLASTTRSLDVDHERWAVLGDEDVERRHRDFEVAVPDLPSHLPAPRPRR
jgi:hypothetical protein